MGVWLPPPTDSEHPSLLEIMSNQLQVNDVDPVSVPLAPPLDSNFGPDISLGSTSDPCSELGLAQVLSPTIGPHVARGRRSKAQVPILTTEVHRSTRSTRYDGFRVLALSDARPTASKVKPRLAPSAASSSSSGDAVLPPPTPIATLQDIGVNRYVIPPQELSENAMLSATPAATQSDDAALDSASAGDGPAPSA